MRSFAYCLGRESISPNPKFSFSPYVDQGKRETFSNILGFRSTPNLGSYLGFPLRHAGSSNQDLNFVLSRVEQKLAGWKANLLSFAGRKVLVQASISSIPSYVMQSALLPTRILDNLDKTSQNFLWGSSEAKRKMHWVGWNKVPKSKAEGGLGFQSAKGRNLAYLSKLNRRFHEEKNALWSQVLRKKYLSQRRLRSSNESCLPSSCTWKASSKRKGDL